MITPVYTDLETASASLRALAAAATPHLCMLLHYNSSTIRGLQATHSFHTAICSRVTASTARSGLQHNGFRTACRQQQVKPRAMAAEAIDLTLSDSDGEAESPTAAAAREAAQRQRIMEFARAKQRARVQDPSTAEPAAAAAAAAAAGAGASTQQEDTAAAGTAAAAGLAAGSNSGSSFGNDDLKALHEARMQRLKAQRQAAAGTSAAAGGSPRSRSRSRSSDSDNPQQGGRADAATAAGTSNRGGAPSWFTEQLAGSSSSAQQVSLLTYNVWFREDVACRQRMQGISDVITAAGHPTFVCLQEVTPCIMAIFASMPWWQRYVVSPAPEDAPYFTLLLVNKAAAPSASRSSFEEVHFDNSCMGRSLRVATVTLTGGRKVLVATSHLESPIPPTQWYSRERQQQMGFSLAQLDKAPYGNVLFAGDMNWTDSRDGPPPLPDGWVDAWQRLHPGEPGYTYDSNSNPMLPYKNPGLRLDRIFTRLSQYRLSSVCIVGKDRLGEATYTHTFRSGGSKQLPVLPSDHFGLLLKLETVPAE